jgi:hypothetical protein
MNMRRLVAVCVLAVLLAGCSDQEISPKLSMPGGPMPPAYLTINDVANNQPLSFGDIVLCVDSPGTVVVTNVAIRDNQGGLHVDAFAVRPIAGLANAVGDEKQTLASIGNGFDLSRPQSISAVCPPEDELQTWNGGIELAVQVSRPSGDVAGGHGLDITYQAKGLTATYSIPFGILACAATCPTPSGWMPAGAASP